MHRSQMARDRGNRDSCSTPHDRRHQPAVPKPGRIPQVDVVVATDELHRGLDQDGAALRRRGRDGHGEVPAGGKLVPDPQQPFTSQR